MTAVGPSPADVLLVAVEEPRPGQDSASLSLII
jgi:hypothetical protein